MIDRLMKNENSTLSSEKINTTTNNDDESLIGVQFSNGIGELNSFINVNIHLVYHIKEISDFIVSEDFPYVYKYNLQQELKVNSKDDDITNI